MIEDGLSYPVRGEWIGRILIGTVLVFFSWLVIPAIIVSGYFVRVMGHTAQGKDEPPEFEDWGGLLVDGVKAWIVGFAYAIVPTVLWFLVVTVIAGASVGVGGEAGAGFGLVAMLTTMLMFVPLMFLIAYLLPAAYTNMATEGRLGAAFDFGTLKTAWKSGDYVIAIVIAVVVSIAISIVMNVLAITVVGLLLFPTLYFYSYVAVSRIAAQGYRNASERTTGEPAPAAPVA